MDTISVCLITHNEGDLISNCLVWLDNLKNVDQICIVDSFSEDKTWTCIQQLCPYKEKKYIQSEFIGFASQKNKCMAMANGDWILIIDADETYSKGMDELLGDLKNNPQKFKSVNAFRFETIKTFNDFDHYIPHLNRLSDPHTRLFRGHQFMEYRNECHERPFKISTNTDFHEYKGPQIFEIYRSSYKNIVLLHHQQLKSIESLVRKGQRWAELDMLKKSAEQGLKVDAFSWVREKLNNEKSAMSEISSAMRQY